MVHGKEVVRGQGEISGRDPQCEDFHEGVSRFHAGGQTAEVFRLKVVVRYRGGNGIDGGFLGGDPCRNGSVAHEIPPSGVGVDVFRALVKDNPSGRSEGEQKDPAVLEPLS